MRSHTLPPQFYRRRYGLPRTRSHPSPGDKLLPFGRCPTRTGTVTENYQRSMTLRRFRQKAKHLMSHVWHELVEVLHRFTDVHLPGPFAFLNTCASCRAVGRTERCELGTLDRGFVNVSMGHVHYPPPMLAISHRFPSFRREVDPRIPIARMTAK